MPRIVTHTQMDLSQRRPLQALNLAVSIVVYRPDLEMLARTLASLAQSVEIAQGRGVLNSVAVDIIDNGSENPGLVDRVVADEISARGNVSLRVLRGHGNVGYGRGHNLSIKDQSAEFHLVLNPDVIMDPEALTAGVEYLANNHDVAMLTPEVRGEAGELQFLCRRYPDVFTLFLRGFAPRPVQNAFRHRLDRYELRDVMTANEQCRVPIASGCFMLARTSALQAVNGFSDSFFLYFEDYDLSMRLRKRFAIAYVPAVKIVHAGGGAAKKGMRHIKLYVASAVRFFTRHGWKFA